MSDQSDPSLIRFEIGEHRYVAVPHPATEGMAISFRLTSMAMGVLGKILSSDVDLAELTEKDLDLAGIMSDVSAFVGHEDAPALFRSILTYTSRDGAPLRADANFNKAYNGNYGELFDAAVRVMVGNGFLPGPATFMGVLQTFMAQMEGMTEASAE